MPTNCPLHHRTYACTRGAQADTILKSNLTGALDAMRTTFEADTQAARAEPLQLGQLLQALVKLRTPGEGEADIFPGRRHPLPVTCLYWASFMVSPGVSAGLVSGCARACVRLLGGKGLWEGAGSRGSSPGGERRAPAPPAAGGGAALVIPAEHLRRTLVHPLMTEP